MRHNKLVIWKCADKCCMLQIPLKWHAGTVKHQPFADFATFHRATSYFRAEWLR